MLSLYLSKGFLFLEEKTWIRNFFTSGERGKGFESNIDTDLLGTFWQPKRLTLTGEAHIPLASGRAMHRTGFDFPLDGAMRDHLDRTDFREGDTRVRGDAKST